MWSLRRKALRITICKFCFAIPLYMFHHGANGFRIFDNNRLYLTTQQWMSPGTFRIIETIPILIIINHRTFSAFSQVELFRFRIPSVANSIITKHLYPSTTHLPDRESRSAYQEDPYQHANASHSNMRSLKCFESLRVYRGYICETNYEGMPITLNAGAPALPSPMRQYDKQYSEVVDPMFICKSHLLRSGRLPLNSWHTY